jgi:cytoskeletal protein CcmA (bactofilin family)
MAKDVLITPGLGLIQFKDADGNVDATIQLDDANVLNISGTVSLGDLAADVYIGDGVNEVDIVFEQNGAVRALAGKTLTLGQANSFISLAANITSGANITGNVNVGNLTTAGQLSATGDITGSRIFSTSNGQGTNFSVGDDAWIGDINQADTISIRGRQNAANAYINFGNADSSTRLGRAGSGPLTYNGAFSVSGNVTGGNLLINNNAVITGNLTVNGTETIFNVQTLSVNDKDIIVANNVTGGANVNGAGLQVGNPAVATWFFNNATTSWQSNIGITPTANGTLSLGGISNYWGSAFVTTLSATGNANVGNIGATNAVFTNISGTLTTASQTNITSVGTLGSLTVTANISGGNLLTSGNIVDTGAISIITGSSGNVNLAPNGTNTLVATTTGANITGTLNATGNANVGNLGATTVVATTLTGTLSTASQPNITSVGTLGSLTVTANVAGGNITTAGQVVATGNVTGGNIVTSGRVVATGNIQGALITSSANIEIQNRGILYLNDSDNSNYIGLRSPAALPGNFIYIFPSSYGNAAQVLSTNGAGGLSWVDQSGGGGGSSATQYPNSTVQPVPGATGNFDLSYNYVQTVQETPFATSATDPFGVNLGEVYSMMDPVGEILDPVDLGVLT